MAERTSGKPGAAQQPGHSLHSSRNLHGDGSDHRDFQRQRRFARELLCPPSAHACTFVSGLKKVNQEEGLQSYLAIRMLKILK